MFKSLKTKILASMFLLTLICTLTFMGVSYYEMRTAVTNQMKNDGENLVTVVNREVSKYNLSDGEKISEVLKEVKDQSKDNISYLSLSDTNLKVIASSDDNFAAANKSDKSTDAVASASTENTAAVTGNIKQGKSTGYIYKTDKGDKVYNVSTPFYQGDKLVGNISVGISLNAMNSMIASSMIQIIIISLIVQFIAVILGIIISKNITTPIVNVVNKLDDFSRGDFTVKFESRTKDEIKKLTNALNKSVEMLKQMITDTKGNMEELSKVSCTLKSSSQKVENSSKVVSESITEVAQGIEEQDGNIGQVTTALEKFNQELEQIQAKVNNTTSSSAAIEKTADVGAEKIKELIGSIEEVRDSFGYAASNIQLLSEDTNKIGEIMNVINSVAEQTNLLALNAAIEAARAGEAGKGFSVVAEEIRKLAEQVVSSSKSINDIIGGIVTNVEGVVDTTKDISSKIESQISIIDDTRYAFKNIQTEVHNTTPQFKNISEGLKNIVQEEETLTSNVHEVSAISEQISASTQEISASVQEHALTMRQFTNLASKIDEMTNKVNDSVGKFKID
ncbi:HAMP domain-containing protein [Clostridium sp. YIM B02515]|uniref:HAMP domain-containing protein n=1 Tax=Clostridium rhizosphaerae TaxID=2803861 RepID=A0ABS1TGT2_9CLOT|nr:methyl-accepting chemotaxis protein [Clostridium rhizosphaerae]MBL4937534.1 HAMP domain-containing protein [Clostridium rhizosphaerae]